MGQRVIWATELSAVELYLVRLTLTRVRARGVRPASAVKLEDTDDRAATYLDVLYQRGRQQSESCSLTQMTDREFWAVYGDREGLAASAVSVCRDAGAGNANESAILRSDDLEACRLGYPDVSCAPA